MKIMCSAPKNGFCLLNMGWTELFSGGRNYYRLGISYKCIENNHGILNQKRGGSNPKTLRFYAAADFSKKNPRWKISPISGSLTLSNGFKILRCRRRWSLSFPHWLDLIPTWLVVSTPLRNLSSSVGMMKFPTEWKIIKFMFQTTNQL